MADDVHTVLDDPIAQELLDSRNLLRLGYTALDGSPRVIPIGFFWNGRELVLGTVPGSHKVAALQRDPRVAGTIDEDTMPPRILLLRGTATVEIVDGVIDEWLEASRRHMPDDAFPAFEAQVRDLYRQMAKIVITPTWAKVMDFETRGPEAVERLARERAGERG
jgi:nitroimidazol reductase NimA-like FMN-containing flavoprotein (pyridoxamine 5'-phosphate oxidase superfamily)